MARLPTRLLGVDVSVVSGGGTARGGGESASRNASTLTVMVVLGDERCLRRPMTGCAAAAAARATIQMV